MDKCPYAAVVGSLMYPYVCNRSDIIFTSMFSRHQSDPEMPYWVGVKKILRYLSGARNYKFFYRKSDQAK